MLKGMNHTAVPRDEGRTEVGQRNTLHGIEGQAHSTEKVNIRSASCCSMLLPDGARRLITDTSRIFAWSDPPFVLGAAYKFRLLDVCTHLVLS